MGVVTVDFDGTLYQGNSFNMMFQVANKSFGLKQWTVVGTGIVKAAAAGLAKGKNALRVQFFKTFAKSFKGMTHTELNDFFYKLVEMGKQDAHYDLIHKIREHERQGDHIMVLSGALSPFLKVFTKEMGLDVHIISTELQVDEDGICTGTVGSVINGDEKVNKVREWIDRQKQLGNLTEAEANETWAYADSESDVPLFQFVKHPVVVNPDETMKEIAVRRGWMLFG
ncbi:HAD-superfamily subfamily IB hydrolase, TIGR01490 [Lentibacillus halodurans]|uniref:HAD-superfamily subfamily IB hydrolase, TIGR01490 n=1 Tax=Lentibacillus halodurans TaxID=237679 RepID=A0A1I0YGD5_9BACI|nr:HAD family hydrolase [Lentibacillus halodurans]SFB11418.1 HAD-superfamily subfamily IB hydrolase, TIGR01490 [Lentibacillus halodurans]